VVASTTSMKDLRSIRIPTANLDPAGIKGMKDVAKAFQIIKEKQACFDKRCGYGGTGVSCENRDEARPKN
jgi:ABC-type tungstate transport system permease subunit